MPGLCRASGLVSYIREWSEGEGDALTFYCETKRKDDPQPIMGKFSVSDAKRANLWKETARTTREGKNGTYTVDSGPWWSYPTRMLQMRARGFCLRDAYPDVLKGLISAEEAADIPFEATGLTPQMPETKPASVREQISAEGPKDPTDASSDEDKVTAKIRELVEKFENTDSLREHNRLFVEKETNKSIEWLKLKRPNRYEAELRPAIVASYQRNKPKPPVEEEPPPHDPIEDEMQGAHEP